MNIHLSWQQPKVGRFALFYLGFRPFFFLASLSAALLGVIWLLSFSGGMTLNTAWPTPALWHGHEMIFGFGMAVIAGFLLTAIRNWTQIQTLHRWPLAVLTGLWLGARIANLFAEGRILAAVLDALFGIMLAVAMSWPIIQTRQWAQIGLISKVWLLVVANFFSYWLADDPAQARTALLFGLLLVVAILITMIHRVLPFFIEKAAQMKQGRHLQLPRGKNLQKWNLVLFLAFTVGWLFWPSHPVTAFIALLLALLNGWLLARWADRVVFHEPLLWSLWAGYAFIVLGFLLIAFSSVFPATNWLGVHAFGAGAMGLTTLGMMIRVTLGHTGRNVFQPGQLAGAMLALVLIAGIVRVLGPLLLPYQYTLLVAFSLVLWILAFGLFWLTYAPMWLRPRIDGHYG